jgi:acetyl esterase/lipase
MKNAVRCMFVFLFVLVISGVAFGQLEAAYKQVENVVYGEADGVGLVMDVFTPTGKAPALLKPSESGKGLGIVDIASGAWHSDRGKIEDHKTARMFHIFCARQYTVFAVRPGSQTKFTGLEMLRNINTAIRYIKAHAAEYNIDPDRLGLTGASAGGHLTCLTVVKAEDSDANAKNPLQRFSTRVKAAGVFFPPTDLVNWEAEGKNGPFDKIGGLLFNGGLAGHTPEEVIEAAHNISPIYFVKPGLPPFMFYHGDADPLVPLRQSQTMVDALKAAGGSAELFIKPGGAHPWITIPEEVFKLADWFDKQLAAK